MNTDPAAAAAVQSLLNAATKPASSHGSSQGPTPKRSETAPVPQEAEVARNTYEPRIVPLPTRDVQETVKAVAARLESYLRSVGREVQLSIDADSGETIITVRDASSGELIRQIPSAEALRLSQALADRPSLVDIVA